FNGKDLTGWTYRGHKGSLDGKTESPDGRVAVENGIIVMRDKDSAGKGGIKVLETAQRFPKPFHLRLEFRASLKSDSGVYLRGPQLQVRDFIRRKEHLHLKGFKNDDWNVLDAVVGNGWMATLVNNRILPPGASLELTVEGGKVTALVNGKPVRGNVEIGKRNVAECSCNGEYFDGLAIPANGVIGLQAETGKFK